MAKRLRAWKAEYLVLTRPLGRAIAETGNSKSARQATFDGHFDQIGCEEGQRDRHIDLADAAFFARGDLFDISHGARDDFIEPAPATSARRDELGAGLRTNRASILRCCEFWHDNLAPPFRRCLLPRNMASANDRRSTEGGATYSSSGRWQMLRHIRWSFRQCLASGSGLAPPPTDAQVIAGTILGIAGMAIDASIHRRHW